MVLETNYFIRPWSYERGTTVGKIVQIAKKGYLNSFVL